jgi:hypothetical protein
MEAMAADAVETSAILFRLSANLLLAGAIM